MPGVTPRFEPGRIARHGKDATASLRLNASKTDLSAVWQAKGIAKVPETMRREESRAWILDAVHFRIEGDLRDGMHKKLALPQNTTVQVGFGVTEGALTWETTLCDFEHRKFNLLSSLVIVQPQRSASSSSFRRSIIIITTTTTEN